jgi:type II secretory pathway component PulL
MLQSVPTRREAYEPQALNQEASKPLPKQASRVVSTPSKHVQSKVAPFPLRRRRLMALVIRKIAFQLMNDEKARKQVVRISLLLLPVLLTAAFTLIMLLGNLAQAQAAQNGNVAPQAAFQRQQMYHASIHVPE